MLSSKFKTEIGDLREVETFQKFNPNHDEIGRFATAMGGAGVAIPINPDSYVESIFPENFHEQLTGMERIAVANYQMQAFRPINEFLRSDGELGFASSQEMTPEFIKQVIGHIDSAIAKAPLVMPDNTAVYRVADVGMIQAMENGEIPSVFTDKGYTSTTMKDYSNVDSAQYKRFEDYGRTIVRIDLGSHKSGLAVNSIHPNTNFVDSQYLDEREFILPRGTKFQFTGYDEANKVYVMKRLT